MRCSSGYRYVFFFVMASLLSIGQLAHAQVRWAEGTVAQPETNATGRWRAVSNAGGNVVFNGNIGWSSSGSKATLTCSSIRNISDTTTSGPLRMVLFYSSSKYPASGTNAAVYEFAPSGLGPQQSIDNVNSGLVNFNPPSACSYRSMLLQEFVGGQWETDNSVTFISPCDLNPAEGPVSGGTQITITGRDLARVSGATFDGISVALDSKSETQIKVTSPAHAIGEVPLRLTDGGAFATLTYKYVAAAPTISSISPTSGPTAGGNAVTINGTELAGVTTVKFGSTSATIDSKTATKIVVIAPPGPAGDVTLRVDSPSGFATKLYQYVAPRPEVTKIDPNHGPAAGGQTVIITGKNFSEVTQVLFDGEKGTIKNKQATSLEVVTPPHAAGVIVVSVRTAGASDGIKYTYDDPKGETQFLPVVGSLPGNLGSFFRTALQLTNPGSAPLSGKIVFHKQGQAPSPSDPSLDYTLPPGGTTAIPDVLPAMNASGLGSLDLQAAPGTTAPRSLVRVFNDGGVNGTTGMTIDFVQPGEALGAGDSAVLLAPSDVGLFRFNIGVRALDADATLNVVVRNSAGTIVRTNPQQFAAGSFTQVSASTIAGGTLAANDSLTFQITAGTVLIYGATTDNITQDPSYQAARRVPLSGSSPMVIPVAGSVAGNFGSFFRTSTQMHNPLSEPITVKVVFHAQGQSGKDTDPSTLVTLQPGETRFFGDIVAAVGTTGLGSVDVIPQGQSRPVVIARIYNDAGAKGTTGMTLDAFPESDALQVNDTAILIAPANAADFRYNIGVRTLDAATLQFTVRNAAGAIKKTHEASYASDFFTQARASDLLGTEIAANDTISIKVLSGAAFLYGSTTDNRTQDPSVQMAETQ
jgi:hypothetical protein